MTATLSHIEGDAAILAGVDCEGRAFCVDIPLRGVIALSKNCADALLSMTRPPLATTDDPPADLVGQQGE